MNPKSSKPEGYRRIDSPERPRRDRRVAAASRPSARMREAVVEEHGSAAWGGEDQLPVSVDSLSAGVVAQTAAEATTLRQSLDEHARSLGETLVARQVELDRREGDLHARLAQIESMRRELEHWSESERAVLAGRGASLDGRARSLDAEADLRRRELDGRESELRRAVATLEAIQRRVEALQRRCETVLSMRQAVAEIGRRVAKSSETTEQAKTNPGTSAMTTRRIDGDGHEGPQPSADTPSRATLRVIEPEPDRHAEAEEPRGSSDLIRLHEALLDKERFLGDEARRLDRDRAAFAEFRLQWVEGHLRATRGPDVKEAMRELRSVREELAALRDERVRVQARRHERMRRLLEAIEDEFKRLDIAWASMPRVGV